MRHDSDRVAEPLVEHVRPVRHASAAGPAVRAVLVERGMHLVAKRAFPAGALVLELEGVLTATPDRYSVQVGAGQHIEPPQGSDDADPRYLWRFLNHSCRPNAEFVGRQLIAIRPIRTGEEITFDYETTEESMAEPFRCHCGHCGGRLIQGWRASARTPS